MRVPALLRGDVIPWGAPVPAFGDLSSSRLATLGLNPSNREFVDEVGTELDGVGRRFHTLRSLGLRTWTEATAAHCDQINESCRQYFSLNPYDAWFRRLERIIQGTGYSYYSGSACHLDLIPYATKCKWTELSRAQRDMLHESAGDTLGLLLKNSPIRVLVLNGQSVVQRFEDVSNAAMTCQVFPSWSLARRSTADVQGIGYRGVVDEVAGVALGRKVTVLGFNHNIQSSFGVTVEVMSSIAAWVARVTESVMQ